MDSIKYTFTKEELIDLLKNFYGIMNAQPSTIIINDFEATAEDILFGQREFEESLIERVESMQKELSEIKQKVMSCEDEIQEYGGLPSY